MTTVWERVFAFLTQIALVQSFISCGMAHPENTLPGLPSDLFHKILDIVMCYHEADHTPVSADRKMPPQFALYRTCTALKQALLPRVGSAGLQITADWAPAGTAAFIQRVRAKLSGSFPSAATLRHLDLDLDVGPWTAGYLTKAMLDPGIRSRLATVVTMSFDIKKQSATWRFICDEPRADEAYTAFPSLRTLTLHMTNPSLFIIRQMLRLVGYCTVCSLQAWARLMSKLAHYEMRCLYHAVYPVMHALFTDTRYRYTRYKWDACVGLMGTGIGSLSLLQERAVRSHAPLIRAVPPPPISFPCFHSKRTCRTSTSPASSILIPSSSTRTLWVALLACPTSALCRTCTMSAGTWPGSPTCRAWRGWCIWTYVGMLCR